MTNGQTTPHTFCLKSDSKQNGGQNILYSLAEKIDLHCKIGKKSASGLQKMQQGYIYLELAKELVSVLVTFLHYWENCWL